jgi:hypothetical protein
MSFIKESYVAYKKVQEAADHEISMARGELEAIADKAAQLASMLQGKSDEGNPLEAWVQSKITKAKDYINSVSDYLMYNPEINESYELEETTFEKIYQMQQDGKSAEDIAKELKLKPDLVKKVLGESKVISEGLSDAQIAQLKKEYEPLKGKTITTSQYQQLKNILFKLQDGDLEKLQKQNIPFASTGAGSILRVRKSPVKITNVTVPGLEGMAEEKIPQDYLDYLRTIVLKNVDFYEVPPKQIIQSWRDEKNKDRFKGKMVDYKEAVDMSKVTKYKMISIKGDQKEITIDREDLEKHLKLGYVIKEPLTEETTFWWHDGKTGYVKAGYDNKELVAWLKKNGYKPEKKEEVEVKEENEYVAVHFKKGKTGVTANSSYEAAKKASEKLGLKNTAGVTVYLTKKDGKDVIHTATEEVQLQEKPSRKKHVVFKLGDKLVAKDFRGYNDDEIAKSIDDFLKQNSKSIVVQQSPIQSVTEETELKPVPSLEDSAKKHKVDVEVLKKQLEKGIQVEKEHTKDEKTAEKIALAHIDERPDYYDQLSKVEKQPVAESHFAIGQHVIYHGPKNPLTPIKAQIIGVATPQTGAYYQIKKDDGETTYAAPDQMKLDEACWTGYKQVGLKKKSGKMVPNCVPEETIKEEKRLYIESIVAVKNKAEKSGMPYSILKQVYDRGMAAWKGGHRPGATQVQWALARVNSFVTKSSGTWGGADSDLAKKVKGD